MHTLACALLIGVVAPHAEPTVRGATPSWSPPTEAERAVDALKASVTGQITPLSRPSAGEPTMGPLGDVASLPKGAPEAHWLPLDVTREGHVVTTVFINGKPVRARLDTGSNVNIVREAVAEELGLMSPFVVRRPSKLKLGDENYDVQLAYADTLDIGPVRIKPASFAIPRRDANADVLPSLAYDAIVAYGVLENTDLLFAIDQGLVGVFMPTEGKLAANARKVKLYVDNKKIMFDPSVNRPFIGAAGHLWALAVVDRTVVPLRINTGASSTGWFRAPDQVAHFMLGDVDVGAIKPVWRGLLELGNDVLLRSRSLISARAETLQLAPIPFRPPTRSKGPDGVACDAGPCVAASIDDVGRVCLDVDKAWHDRRALAVIDVVNASGASVIGGAFVIAHVEVGADGAHACSRPLGVTKEQRVSLLRWNVVERANDLASCPTAPCMFVTRE